MQYQQHQEIRTNAVRLSHCPDSPIVTLEDMARNFKGFEITHDAVSFIAGRIGYILCVDGDFYACNGQTEPTQFDPNNWNELLFIRKIVGKNFELRRSAMNHEQRVLHSVRKRLQQAKRAARQRANSK